MYFATAYFVHDFEDNFQVKTVAHLHKLITIKKESGITLYYLLIPSSNENNLIYLRSSEWGKNFKNNKLQVVAPCWVMYSSKIRLAPETNNKALIQNIIILMTHIVAVLSYFLAILSWNKMHIVASLIYFPTSLSWNMTHMVTALSYFLASLSSNMTQIVAALRCTTWSDGIRSYSGPHLGWIRRDTPQWHFPTTLSWKMTNIVTSLSYFTATLKWKMKNIVTSLNYFTTTLNWKMKNIVTSLNYFTATLNWKMRNIVASLNYFLATLNWNIT